MKLRFFILKPHLDQTRIDKIVKGQIEEFMKTVEVIDVTMSGYSDNEIAVMVKYKEKTQLTKKK